MPRDKIAKRKPGKTYAERLPQDRGSAKMPNPGRGYVRDPESRRKEPVAKSAPKRRKHQKV